MNADSLPAIVPLRHSDGYEPIDTTSLLEKIHYELERKQFDSSCAVFRVLIVGDWNAAQFRFLRDLLPENLTFHFTLITRFSDDGKNLNALNERIVLETKSYANFWGKRNNFLSLMRASDLSFFLDCKELYSRLRIKPERDLSAFLQWSRTENYTALRNRLESSGVSYLPGNKFFKMRDLLVGAAYNDVPGCLDNLEELEPFRDIRYNLNRSGVTIRFARNGSAYRKYLSDAIDEFEYDVGLKIIDDEEAPKTE